MVDFRRRQIPRPRSEARAPTPPDVKTAFSTRHITPALRRSPSPFYDRGPHSLHGAGQLLRIASDGPTFLSDVYQEGAFSPSRSSRIRVTSRPSSTFLSFLPDQWRFPFAARIRLETFPMGEDFSGADVGRPFFPFSRRMNRS